MRGSVIGGVCAVIAVGLAACGPAGAGASAETSAKVPARGVAPAGADPAKGADPGAKGPADGPKPTSAQVAAAAPPTAAAVFARLQPDFTACFAEGRKATPEMTGGKITMHVSVDAAGHTACVIPSDDTGLTQDVEDCIRMRLDRETYDTRSAWSMELPLTVKDGAVSLRVGGAKVPVLENVETHGMPDAFGVIESALPGLTACFSGLDRRGGGAVVYVGARVGKDGAVECALTTSSRAMPAPMRACAAGVLEKTRFPKPKTPVGLVSIPISI